MSTKNSGEARVVAVVVTFNRETLIGECLDALGAQTRPLDAVVVVNNASTDASGEVAEKHPLGAHTIHLHRNVGGAGGFSAGMASALANFDPDFLWIMDDDTIPTPTALEELLKVNDQLDSPASVLSSTAVWTDGRVHPMNSARTRLGTPQHKIERFARIGARPIRTASFVSALINAHDARKHGLPHADYFIWSDDFEYTGRLLKNSQGFAVENSRVVHKTVLFSNAQTNPGARFYYDVRNRLWALLRTDSFTKKEVALYGGKSVLGWVRTLVRTKGQLLPIAFKGVRDALDSGPRASAVVLSADPEIADTVREINDAAGTQ